jgi:hypothetical protein
MDEAMIQTLDVAAKINAFFAPPGSADAPSAGAADVRGLRA